MFLDNLATSLLRLCGHKEFSYERAAEECGLSSRFFGNIVRKTSAPTVVTLEKLCNGFQTTPDDLLLPSSGFPGELRFRSPMKVTQVRCFFYGSGLTGYPVCPQCGSSLEREYQCYCDRCGNVWTGKTSQKQPLSLQKPDPFVIRLSPDQRIFALVCFLIPIFPPLFFAAFFHFPLDFLFADCFFFFQT